MADVNNSRAMRRKSRGKEVAKEKKVPRRGMGVARLERMRLLQQKRLFEEGDTGNKARTAPLFSYFLPLSYFLQRFPQVDAERGAFEVAWSRGQWQFLESSVTTPISLLERVDEIHTIRRGCSFTSMDGKNIMQYTDSGFSATQKSQVYNVETSDWRGACLDLSLSTANPKNREERNYISQQDINCIQEERCVATGMPRFGLGLERTGVEKGEGNGIGCRCSSCTRTAYFHYGGESSFFTSQSSSLPSPSLQLTLGLPS